MDESQQLDQTSDSSNQQSTEGSEVDDTDDTFTGLQEVQEALIRKKNVVSTTIAPRTTRKSFTKLLSSPRPIISTTHTVIPTLKVTTPFPLTTQKIVLRGPKPQAFDKLAGSQKLSYDYIEDDFTGLLGNLPAHSKVVIHSGGVIQCLDQGNFPHPVSCKKFISCAKMETGKVIGWEYTCPKNLSFDPVGGMCNWSADLGCEE